MYMTRIFLKNYPTPNIVHGILSAAFPGKRNELSNENLWRIDSLGDSRVLIIVSTSPPDITEIVRKIGANKLSAGDSEEKTDADKTLDYAPFLRQISDGQAWRFRVCANPVEHKKQTPSDKRGKIFALRSIEEQLEWLNRQGEKSGFSVKGCAIINDSWIAFNKVRIRAVTYDGVLTVTDADAFRTVLSQGIGRGKAYGCGLLTVARIQE